MSYSKKSMSGKKNPENGRKLARQEYVAWTCAFLGVLSFFLLNIIVGAFLFAVGVFALVYTKFQQYQRGKES